MGVLYIKVIESKKVAVRNSFFVNYPFIRVVVGSEKKSTNFKPGVEWWDKILTFRGIAQGDHQQIIVQARDKSIHVFGSDWLGEVSINLDRENFLDGKVHQTWFKFGRGRKSHSRTPRGYIHLAFHLINDDHPASGKRPFSVAPVEKVLTFEEWLATSNTTWSSDSSAWLSNADPSSEPGWKVPQDPRLRQSAPSDNRLTPDEPRRRANTIHHANPSSDESINPDSPGKLARAKARESQEDRKLSNTRQRAQTLPDVRSPSMVRQQREKKQALRYSSDDEDDFDADGEPHTANLIDFSFDTVKPKYGGQQPMSMPMKTSVPASMPASMPSSSATPASLDDQIAHIKKLSLSSEPVVPPGGFESQINHDPTFSEWYHYSNGASTISKPSNPFLAMHENFEPTMTAKN